MARQLNAEIRLAITVDVARYDAVAAAETLAQLSCSMGEIRPADEVERLIIRHLSICVDKDF